MIVTLQHIPPTKIQRLTARTKKMDLLEVLGLVTLAGPLVPLVIVNVLVRVIIIYWELPCRLNAHLVLMVMTITASKKPRHVYSAIGVPTEGTVAVHQEVHAAKAIVNHALMEHIHHLKIHV
jgi:hypothetical protein